MAVATAVLYLWGQLYVAGRARGLGIPPDFPVMGPAAYVSSGATAAIETSVFGTYFLFSLVLLYFSTTSAPHVRRFAFEVIRLWFPRFGGRSQAETSSQPKAAKEFPVFGYHPDPVLVLAFIRLGLAMSIVFCILAVGVRAKSKGEEFAREAIQDCRVVTIHLVDSPEDQMVQYCASIGDQLVLKVDGTVVLLRRDRLIQMSLPTPRKTKGT